MKNQKNNLNKRRLKVLETAKKIIPFEGWNENIIKFVSNKSNLSIFEIEALFPNGYRDLLEFYLNNLDNEMIKKVKSINLNNLRTHEKIYKIIMIRINNNIKEKELFRKTMFNLSMPFNAKIAISSVYKTVDNMWYLTNDRSYDFNYYTKRAILAFIYSSTIFFWINDDSNDIKNIEIFLKKQIKKTSSIKGVKNFFINNLNRVPNIINFRKVFKKPS
tara:strand:+ start:308 stop:961 length:654 start_codon:yes stop_codon:yes gene_type:complete